jgi:hypothetical protein
LVDDKLSSLNAKASPSELRQIELFQSRAAKLFNNSLVTNRFNPSADLHIDKENGSSFSFQLPYEESFESLLMRFRHFWLQKKDSCNFFKILNIVDHRVPQTRNCTASLRIAWNKGLFHSTAIIIDNTELTSKEIIDLWLNSEFFHNVEAKKLKLDKMINRIDLISPGLSRSLLVGSIFECCNVIFDLNELLEKIHFDEL